MYYYFAPMEGLTDSIYRKLHHKHFGGVDRYYMPFLSPTIHRTLTRKEDRELPMADSVDFVAIPQILTKVPDDFLWAVEQCRDRGYAEVNLNIGCPSGTVVAKGKGAGMLADPDGLDRFLDAIYARAVLPVSVKSRIGIHEDVEFSRLIDIFNQYPICELIIHPRTRKDFYNGPIRTEAFEYAIRSSKNPLCYNGDLCSLQDIQGITHRYPQLRSVMLGRGLVADPGMLTTSGTTTASVQAFHNELLDTYTSAFGSTGNAICRMKENWHYLGSRFEGADKLLKRLRKTTDIHEFRSISNEIFHTIPMK